ncbi:unnamed protein product [Strongylus vulgaris]|uniref:Acyltransferase 3 domain-containing protein n=1 Tax=Strongylus vulgaris TaxID=40348 RepID=A0A3P7J8Y6_STRVU|nr:unnamed protein product [Strongylus vulgaris]
MGFFAIVDFTKFFDLQYVKPWTRCPPFLIGIAVGYGLALGKKPRISKFFVAPLWMLAAAIALASLYGPHNYIKGDNNWGVVTRATYNNFSRIGWTLAVCWVIVANHWGWGGLIASFMDHPIWQPLGRLSYCGYIVHYFLIRYVYNLDDRPAHFTSIWRTYIHKVIPIVVVSYVFAFFWSCLFEVPIVKLEKMLTAELTPKKSSQKHKPGSCEFAEAAGMKTGKTLISNGDVDKERVNGDEEPRLAVEKNSDGSAELTSVRVR